MRTKIILVILLCLLMAGCNEVQLSPRYQQIVEMSAINVENMHKDCVAGNQQSCEKGLEEAARTLQLLVDASYGRVGE